MIKLICEVILSILEMCCILIVSYDLLGVQGRNIFRENALLLMAEIPILFSINIYTEWGSGVGLLLSDALLFAGIFLIYRESLFNSFLCFMISYMYAGVLELVLYFPVRVLPLGPDGGISRIAVNVAALLAVVFLCHKKGWIPWSSIRQFIRQKNTLPRCLIVIVWFVMWISRYRFRGVYGMSGFVILLLIVLVLFFLLLSFFYIRKEIELRERSKYERSVLDILARIQQNQHQYDHRLNVIYGMIRHYQNYEELTSNLTEYMASIEKVDVCYDLMTALEDPLLAGFLGVKLSQAAEKNIEIKTEILVSEIQSGVPLPELVGLLGNILDNAVEEVTENELPLKIRLRIREDAGWYEIRVENPCRDTVPDQIHAFSRKGFSTKEGAGRRGFGLSSVADTVSRHRGKLFLATEQEDGVDWFFVEIRLRKKFD